MVPEPQSYFTRSQDGLIVHRDGTKPSPGLIDYRLERVPFGSSSTRDGAPSPVRLSYVGVAFGGFSETNLGAGSVEVEGRFYDAALQPIARAELTHRWPKVSPRFTVQGRYPSVRFGFASDYTFRYVEAHLFDARTKSALSSSIGARRSSEQALELELQVPHWHQAPLELVLDIARAPSQQVYLKPVDGAFAKIGSHYVELVAGLPGRVTSYESGNSSIKYPIEPSTSDRASTFVFRWASDAQSGLTEIAFLNHRGELIEGHRMGASGEFALVTCEAGIAKIAQIRFDCFTTIERVVFEFPYLPGLPEENLQARNLFDITIPQLVAKDAGGLAQFIAETTQMTFLGGASATQFPTNYFPRMYRDITPRRLLGEFTAHSTGRTLEVDAQAHTLRLRETRVEAFKNWCRQQWKKRF